MSGWSRSIVLSAAVALAACQDQSPEARLNDYLTRIARVTEADARLPPAEILAPYPARRDLMLDIPRRTVEVGEFFELHGCDMGALVGFRNSPLGRLQSASQRLGYEAAWLAAAASCGAEQPGWLPEMAAAKRDELPSLFWNATFADDEMRIALGASGAPAGGRLADILRGLGDSLTRVLHGGFETSELEHLLGRLRQGSWVGPARQNWSRWRRYLGAAAAMLEQATPKICLNRQPTPRANRLKNVFLKLYIQRIQPDLAARMGEHEDWVVELERLSGRLRAVQPSAYRRWFDTVLAPDRAGSEWRRTRRAVVAHAEAWQGLFAHCGLEPASGLRQD